MATESISLVSRLTQTKDRCPYSLEPGPGWKDCRVSFGIAIRAKVQPMIVSAGHVATATLRAYVDVRHVMAIPT